jgi:predicted phage terminase large subunit-like protein
LIEFISSPDDGSAIFPRGFAKSTWVKIDTIHDIVYGLEPVILYISATLNDAQFHFDSIKNELESNEWLQTIYDNLVPKMDLLGNKWTNKHFQTTNGINVVARGAGKGRGVNIRNRRPTKIIVDDAESDEQVHSSQRREKYHRWIYEVIMPSRDKERGRIKVIGTVIHPECEVLKFYEAHGGIFRRAIENGQSIWPNFWSLGDLIRVRDGYIDADGKQHEGIGILAFSQEYLNEPINSDATVFDRKAIERNVYEELPPLEWLEIKMAVDPNAGQSRMADFMGICVLGRDKRTMKRYVLEARKFKGKLTSLDVNEDTQESVFDSVYTRWEPIVAGIECVRTMGIALHQLLLSKNKYRLIQVSPEGKDKVARAQMVSPFVEQDIIKFSATHVDLYNEMIVFPNGEHDDVVDAFIHVNDMFTSNSVKLDTKKRSGITTGLRTKQF